MQKQLPATGIEQDMEGIIVRIIMIAVLSTVLILLVSIILPPGIMACEDEECFEYVTLTGKISLTGSEPLVIPVITAEETSYSLSGEYRGELRRLSGAEVKITGKIMKAVYPLTEGDLQVSDYRIMDPGSPQNLDWAAGELGRDCKGLVIVGDDQIIYRLENIEVFSLQEKVGSRLLIAGSIKAEKNHQVIMEVKSYKMLREKNSLQVYLHRENDRKEIKEKTEQEKVVKPLLSTLETAVEERLRLYIDVNDVRPQLEQEKALEVYFPEGKKLEMEKFGAQELSRIILFFTGRFASDLESPLVTVLTMAVNGSWQVWGCDLQQRDIFQEFMQDKF